VRHGGFPSHQNLLREPKPIILLFFPPNEKPIKAVIRNLPHNTPAEDISDGLVSLGFDVINVKEMTTRRSPPEESKVIILALFLVTLPSTPKSQDIFRLPSLATSLSG
jgi:hypothetical protein